MSGFLAHASDARDFLMRLILHQRDNLEDQARRSAGLPSYSGTKRSAKSPIWQRIPWQ